MVIHKFNSFRRYTPPTCTLEIYHPQPFWGRWRYQSFPPLFSFQLHFDDPRLPQDDRISIIGDRNLLEKLRIKIEEYVNHYLQKVTIDSQGVSCEIADPEEGDIIYISRQSTYNHLLYYQSFIPHQEVVGVSLSNTQLVDLVNALEAYHWDATNEKGKKPPQKFFTLSKAITLSALLATLGGVMWWNYQSQENLQVREEPPELPVEQYQNNIRAVVPPSPLDLDNVPQIINPTIPQPLLNQASLLPPPTITQPPTNLPISSNDQIIQENSGVTTTITPNNPSPQAQKSPSAPKPVVNPSVITALKPSFAPETPSGSSTEAKPNNQASSGPSSLPVLSSANPPGNSSAIANLSPLNNNSLSSSTALNPETNSKPAEELQQQLTASNPTLVAKKISQDVSAEVKQYFEDKWNPPENLKQSIEYRLRLNENGTLAQITPVGQVAAIFIDQTPMPLIGEVVTSSFSEVSPLTVRLILAPNGNVQTFAEY